jgi:hypothetical protein
MQVAVSGHGTMLQSTNPAGSLGAGVIDAVALGARVATPVLGVEVGIPLAAGAELTGAELPGGELGSERPGAATGCDDRGRDEIEPAWHAHSATSLQEFRPHRGDRRPPSAVAPMKTRRAVARLTHAAPTQNK